MSGSSTLPPTDPQGGGSLVDAAKEGYAARRSALEAEDGRSLGEMLSAVTTNVSTLMQQEMALAKAELKQSGMRAGKGNYSLIPLKRLKAVRKPLGIH